jgi:hypothetical protein
MAPGLMFGISQRDVGFLDRELTVARAAGSDARAPVAGRAPAFEGSLHGEPTRATLKIAPSGQPPGSSRVAIIRTG